MRCPSASPLALFLALAASTLFWGGCSPERDARLYVLTPLAQGEALVSTTTGTRHLTIGVGPVDLPRYVNRPQIVTGHLAPELQSAALAQWAEPLQDGFIRVLAENLSLLLGTERVMLFPWKSAVPAYQVIVDVTHFLGQPGGEVSLVALWSILGKQGKEALISQKSRFRETTGAADYAALAAAMSRTVAALSRDIATALATLPQ